MCRHVVCTFECVGIVGIVFAREFVECHVEIASHVRVGILVQSESGRGVFDKEVKNALLGQWRKMSHYLFCDEMEPSRPGRKCKFGLVYHVV